MSEISYLYIARLGLARNVLRAGYMLLEKLALLTAHGYPDLPGVDVPVKIANEIKRKRAAIDAAWNIFGEKR